jgi:hypothetical protein
MNRDLVMQPTVPVWTDLRDKQGKLCARLDVRRCVLEIRRSDRDQLAVFDLRDYIAILRVYAEDNV